MSFSKNKTILYIVILSFFASLAFSFYFQIKPAVDAKAYDTIARNLVVGNGYREDMTVPIAKDTSIIRAGPGYEFFLASIYWVFGHNIKIVWIIQAFLHAATVYLVYLCALDLFEEKKEEIATVAALFIGFHPDLIEISAMLMSETLYLFFVALALLFLIKTIKNTDSFKNILWTSFFISIASFTRPPVLLFELVFIFILLSKKKMYSTIISLGIIVLLFLPWTIRNYEVYHEFIPDSLVDQYNLWGGNFIGSSGGQISDIKNNPTAAYQDTHTMAEFKNEAERQFLSFVFYHPIVFLELTGLRIVRYFSLIRPMGFWFYTYGIKKDLIIFSSFIFNLILMVCGYSGIFYKWKEKNKLQKYIALLAFTAPLAIIFAVVESRYRFQIYPFLALFGGYALLEVYPDFRDRWKKVFLPSTMYLGIITIFDVIIFGGVVITHILKIL